MKKITNPFKLTDYDLDYYFEELVAYFNPYEEETHINWNKVKDIRKINEERTQRVWRCAKEWLSASEFQCFYSFYGENLQQERIAEIMGVTQGYVHKAIKNSVKKIRKKINTGMEQLTFEDLDNV